MRCDGKFTVGLISVRVFVCMQSIYRDHIQVMSLLPSRLHGDSNLCPQLHDPGVSCSDLVVSWIFDDVVGFESVPTEVRHITGKSFLVENARMSTKKRVSPRLVLHLWFSGIVVTEKETDVQSCFCAYFCSEMRWGHQLLMYPQK